MPRTTQFLAFDAFPADDAPGPDDAEMHRFDRRLEEHMQGRPALEDKSLTARRTARRGAPTQPVQNLRITFWGVQGSCPIFPARREVRDYERRVARYAIRAALIDLAEKLESGELTADALRDLVAPADLAAYQKHLGLPRLPVFGGDTTCAEVETAEGNVLLFDLGTGVRSFSDVLLRRWADREDRTLHIFATHQHLDHRNGLAFASFCFANPKPFNLELYGPREFLQSLDDRYGIYSRTIQPVTYQDDPLDFQLMTANFRGTELRTAGDHSGLHLSNGSTARPWAVRDVREPIHIGETVVTPFEIYHGSTECLAYKVTHGGSSFVFCTDHEMRRGDNADPRQIRSDQAEARLREQCRGADVAYFDGQYLKDEYLGIKGIGASAAMSRVDWGHGCIEDGIARATECGIRRTFLGHHDPSRSWDERAKIDDMLRGLCAGQDWSIELAQVETVIDV